ncbi:hypothetical protein CVT26_003202 [Gymnopilus dilepis]|uniref:C2H2-type domain-containing protein n=1 Tax=Gymnopilus dilepis TaxID=231916 RepID=A0A409Y531_9AGAR|nr:hypothetical protein CVT26_003202 [Gymnopilus dilepis]
MYSIFPATELLNSLLFSDIDDDSMTDALEPLFINDDPISFSPYSFSPSFQLQEDQSYIHAFRSPLPEPQLCIDPALIYTPPTPATPFSDSGTESEPSTPVPRRSTRYRKLPTIDYNDDSSSEVEVVTTSRRRRVRSGAASVKSEIISELPASKVRVRSPGNIAASDNRRVGEITFFCPRDGCEHPGFTAQHNLTKHLDWHDKIVKENKRCPHPDCTYFTFYGDLIRHMRTHTRRRKVNQRRRR